MSGSGVRKTGAASGHRRTDFDCVRIVIILIVVAYHGMTVFGRGTGVILAADEWYELFVCSVVALPLFRLLERPRGKRLVNRLASLCDLPCGIFLFAVPLALVQYLLRPSSPWTFAIFNDWAMLSWFFCMYVFGFVLMSDPRFWAALRRNTVPALVGGTMLTSVDFWLEGGLRWIEFDRSLASLLVFLFLALRTWAWVLAALGLASRWLQFPKSSRKPSSGAQGKLSHAAGVKTGRHQMGDGVAERNLPVPRHFTRATTRYQTFWEFEGRGFAYIREASYPFYIIHQTVLIAIAFHVLKWEAHVLVRFAAITTSTVVATLVIYEVAVRRWAVTRFLLGMRPKVRCAKTAPSRTH